MHFDETPEEAAFRAEVAEWLEANAPAKGSPEAFDHVMTEARSGEAEEEYARRCVAWQQKLADDGWAGLTWPVEYGGRGLTPLHQLVFDEESARYGVATALFMAAQEMAGPTLMAHGTPEQQQRFLGPILRGQIWCQLFSEPNAGSDLAGLRTRGVIDGDEIVVNGQKVWNSHAHQSEYGLLLLRTDFDVPKHRGLTYVIVPMGSPGIELRPLRQITGATEFNETFFDDVRIPLDNVVGEVNGGWGVAQTTLNSERGAVGSMASSVDVAGLVRLAADRGVAGDPVVRQGLASAWIRQELLRYLGMRARTALAAGRPLGPEASLMKIAVGEHAAECASLGLSIDPSSRPWQLLALSHFGMKIGGGTPEVQRNVLGDRVLGLPPEPRVDKGIPFSQIPG